MKIFYRDYEVTCWDNEDGGDGGAGDGGDAATAAAATAAAAAAAAAGSAEKSFTQTEVDEMVVKRNKTANAQLAKAEENYETLLKQKNLGTEQRDKIQADLDAVKNEMMTKEQRLESEKKKAAVQFETDLTAANTRADKFEQLYNTSTINREIQDEAIKADGFSGDQFIAHLAPMSFMSEERDSAGETTGKLIPRVKWSAVDAETGAIVTTDITPGEAIEKMKENVVDFGNMFKPNVSAGIGQGTAPGQPAVSGNVNHKTMSTAEYMALAKDPVARRQMLSGSA